MKRKKITLLILFPLVVGLFFLGRMTAKNTHSARTDEELVYTEIPADAVTLTCKSSMTVSVSGQNNPDNKGLFGKIWEEDNNLEFHININDNQLTISGFEVFQETDTWHISLNGDLLIADLLPPRRENPNAQNQFTIFLDKETGQGTMTRNWLNQYVNRQVSNYSTYFQCTN